ncbi:FAD-dependent pyridine nucleotide-disulphide oxidoreductase [Thermosinus carboxydivorans Nor1]|uniref:FAD-dependent pyridine nucleotide-disulphide oxidoreductase n=1 Tax=Thermosinus carboxydivorans Nor1 TaxID=401526 RepID=A1HRK9_9FIRM|nr:FAD-dependent oxidoreductase [Thermosinus carboxydivorans]EAX47339.1 FAD-dependent pyridine nucleotide-disulphide oxidoreductase [Thermosinus carboxydivorans Nor1]
MIKREVVVVGAGPAGLMAAISAAKAGAEVLVLERSPFVGGQLVKQTHKFFGAKSEYAGWRGTEIAGILAAEAAAFKRITIWTNAVAAGYYPDQTLAVAHNQRLRVIKPGKLIIATGAAEKFLLFPNNDLPGIYGAGAVQTLLNLYGVLPGRQFLIVGAGNIGVILAYQLLQANAEVAAIVEAAPAPGCYQVHAAKVQRCGVPFYTSHTIKYAYGSDAVAGAVIWQLDERRQPLPGTEKEVAVDGICIAVGLSPLTELLWQAGCRMKYIPELGGNVPLCDENFRTSEPDIYVAGDAAGVEEASTAMVAGKIAGMAAACALGYQPQWLVDELAEAKARLAMLRAGPVSAKIRAGIKKRQLAEVS